MSTPDPALEARIDAGLVARAVQQDDRAAFGQLILRHQGRVRAQLRRLTGGDHAWADDIAQEVFLTAWRKLAQFRGDARFATWLFRVSYSTFLQAVRRRRSDPLPLPPEEAAQKPAEERESGAWRLDLAAAMARLPEAERAAIVHCYHLGLSHEEAAEVLGMPVGTVKSHVARGKMRLRGLLSDWAPATAVDANTVEPWGDRHG